jgi:hypothetical protein
MFAQAPPSTEVKPQQFNLDATYAYVGKGPQNDNYNGSKGTMAPISQYPSALYFNITRPTIENLKCDAILEVYNIKITSDKGPYENFAYFAGTNYNPSFTQAELNNLTERIYNLIDVNDIDGITGNFLFNWTSDESILSAKVGSFGVYTNYKNGLGLWSTGKPNAVTVIINRIGYVTTTDGIISVQPDTISANNKTQVQLQEFDDGFLKNEIVPIDELSQQNRFQPLKK